MVIAARRRLNAHCVRRVTSLVCGAAKRSCDRVAGAWRPPAPEDQRTPALHAGARVWIPGGASWLGPLPSLVVRSGKSRLKFSTSPH
jgi:hypothetical protein